MAKWTFEDIPDQSGKTAVVTGANSGIGYEATRALAAKGACVILACRNTEKAEAAAKQIHGEYPDAALEVMALDLSDLSSVRTFAADFSGRYSSLDILCNNAGVMALPRRYETADGFEIKTSVKHLTSTTYRLIPYKYSIPVSNSCISPRCRKIKTSIERLCVSYGVSVSR